PTGRRSATTSATTHRFRVCCGRADDSTAIRLVCSPPLSPLDLPSHHFPLLRHIEIDGPNLSVVRHLRAQAASFGPIAIFGYPVTALRHDDSLPSRNLGAYVTTATSG